MIESREHQTAQIKYTGRGYQHRSDPDDYLIKDASPKEKKTRQSYCRLSKTQMLALKNHLIPHIKFLQSTIADLFVETPVELIADKNGTTMTEATFRRVYSKFKNEILTTKEDVKKKVIDLKDAGFSADEIREKLRNVMRPQYLRPILTECGFGSQKSKAEIARELLAKGMSYIEINKKHPEISVKYARELDAINKKKAKNESE